MRRRFKSPREMEELWEEYKKMCDNYTVTRTEFSQRNSEFVSETIPKRITYTIEGFCVYAGLARQKYYETYMKDERYRDITTRIHEECEVDVRSKFETGEIPSQLSALWMSKFGYSTKTDTNIGVADPIVITGGDKLED